MSSRPLARAVWALSQRYPFDWKIARVSEAGRSGQAGKALELFNEMPRKNQVAWNAALAALVDAGRTDWALTFFQKIPRKNATSYATMIGALSRAGAAATARHLFDGLPLNGHNVFTWTAMVSCHARNGDPGRAVRLFMALYGELFARRVLPNAHTFSTLLKACVGLQSLTVAVQLHSVIIKLLDEGSRGCIFVWNALIDVHAKLGALSDAEKVFCHMRFRDVCSWNMMVDAYSRQKLVYRALGLFKLIRNKDAFSWNIMLSCLWENRRGEYALYLFIYMLRLNSHSNSNANAKPDASTYTTVLHICSVLALLMFGRQVHARTVKNGLYSCNVFVCNSLISMYRSCGATVDLKQVFDEMTVRDTVSWNSVVQGLGQNGHGRHALVVAESALQLKMYDGNTFIAILTSCSHAGLVAEGLGYLDAMDEKYCVQRTLDHYICVIDLLGRAGRLEEAHGLLRSMPFTPNEMAWSTLLHSCLAHKNSFIGSIAAQELKALQLDGIGNYERLVRGCGGGGSEADGMPVEASGNDKSATHMPGRSWVIRGEV